MKKLYKNAAQLKSDLEELAESKNKEYIAVWGEGKFILYKEFNFMNLSTRLAYHKAVIKITEEVISVKIRLRSWAIWAMSIFLVFSSCIILFLLIQNDFSFLFFSIVLVIAIISIVLSKYKFRKNIISFLNEI